MPSGFLTQLARTTSNLMLALSHPSRPCYLSPLTLLRTNLGRPGGQDRPIPSSLNISFKTNAVPITMGRVRLVIRDKPHVGGHPGAILRASLTQDNRPRCPPSVGCASPKLALEGKCRLEALASMARNAYQPFRSPFCRDFPPLRETV